MHSYKCTSFAITTLRNLILVRFNNKAQTPNPKLELNL